MATDPLTPKKGSGIETDAELVALWLSGRPPTTVRAYQRDVLVLERAVNKPVSEIGLADVRRFVGALTGADASRARRVATIKSLLTFAFRVGYIETNLGQLVPTPKIRSNLHERVLEEPEVERVIRQARRVRDRILVKTLYLGGLRISEALALRWRDLGDRWLTVHGKGSKTRTVFVPAELVGQMRHLRAGDAKDTGPVFVSARGGALSVRQARAVITKLIDQAIGRPLPPHALRHAHATVALMRGAPIHLVQQTLGHRSLATTQLYLHVRPGEGSSQYLAAPRSEPAKPP